MKIWENQGEFKKKRRKNMRSELIVKKTTFFDTVFSLNGKNISKFHHHEIVL